MNELEPRDQSTRPPRLVYSHAKVYTSYSPKFVIKVWTLVIASLIWVRLATSNALQYRKWQLIGMSRWCRSALCGHPLPALTDNWTHGVASRHTIAPISHTRPSPFSHSYYSFPVPLRVGDWVGLILLLPVQNRTPLSKSFSFPLNTILNYYLASVIVSQRGIILGLLSCLFATTFMTIATTVVMNFQN